jgi:hypothetical protein
MAKFSKDYENKIGRITLLQGEISRIKIQIDAIVKGLLVLFEPIDNDLDYVSHIDVLRLQIYAHDIEEKITALKSSQQNLEDLKSDIGQR